MVPDARAVGDEVGEEHVKDGQSVVSVNNVADSRCTLDD